MRDLPTDADDRKRETAELKGLAGELRGYVEHADAASRWHAGRILNEKFGGSTQQGYGGERVARVARYLHVTESTLIVARWLYLFWKNADIRLANKLGLSYRMALSVLRLDARGWRMDKEIRRGAGNRSREQRSRLVQVFPGADPSSERGEAWEAEIETELGGTGDLCVASAVRTVSVLEEVIIAYLHRPLIRPAGLSLAPTQAPQGPRAIIDLQAEMERIRKGMRKRDP